MASGAKVSLGHPIHSVRMNPDLTRRIQAVADAMGVPWSGALRMLVAKGLGDQIEASILREKVQAVNALLRRRQADIIGMLRQRMLEMVDDVAPAEKPAPRVLEREDEFGDEDGQQALEGARSRSKARVVDINQARGRQKRVA